MTYEAIVIADSISAAGKRITTFQLKYPRFIHAELMTHRMFSRNASSSRAIPVAKMIDMVRNDPAMPIHWGKNQPGMQAKEEIQHVGHAKDLWLQAARMAAAKAEVMNQLGLHKQVVNRILEPFQHISVVLTATEYNNWFALRDHEDAQPEIQKLAVMMREAMDASVPTLLHEGEWHLPYVSAEEQLEVTPEIARQVSAARCARTSHLKHDGTKASIEEELALCTRLFGSQPLHASPSEHQATPDTITDTDCFGAGGGWSKPELHGNLIGWIQYRKLLPYENVPG